MSCSYAEGLSKYENKGKLGLPEKFDTPDEVERKVQILAKWMKESRHTVIHTGAGISTAAGIPDFRGPNGVWTLEKEGLKPQVNISWDDAQPTLTHMAIVSLEQRGYVQYVVTQNIDGLHLRSGLQRKKLAELHGDMFVDKCNLCQRQFVRCSAATTVAQKSEGKSCPGKRSNGRRCRGKLHDNILDWEDGLPDADLDLAISHACVADLSLCLGTTLQIVPSGNIPVDTKKRGGRLVICNLQPTKQDRHADLIINTYVDDLMRRLLEVLDIPLLPYSSEDDPLKITQLLLQRSGVRGESDDCAFEPIEWTIPEEWVKDKDLAERVRSKKVIRKRPGVKEDATQERKKVKIDQVPLAGKAIKERKEEEKGFSCHTNGEVELKKNDVKEEEKNIIKKEIDTAKSIKEKETAKIEQLDTLCKEKGSDLIKVIGLDETKTENEIKEEEKIRGSEVYSSGNTELEDIKEEEEVRGSEAYSNGMDNNTMRQSEEGNSDIAKANGSAENQNDLDT